MPFTAKSAQRRVGLTKKPRPSGPFQYSPLRDATKQIRLLRVRPASSLTQRLICDLLTYDRAAAPQYNAISYRWGDSTPMRVVRINGHNLMVRKNCWFALAQARYHQDEDSLIWIDAICINQDDTAEKNGQVSIMGNIFEQADCVFACIGPMTDSADCVFDVADELSNMRGCAEDKCPASSRHDSSRPSFKDAEVHVAHAWLQSIDAHRLNRIVDAMSSFCANEYWERLWIVQEISLAGCKYAGPDNILQPVILEKGIDCRVIQACIDPLEPEINAFSTLCDYYWENGDSGMDLNFALVTLTQWKCTDARDRIYGLLRLIHWPGAYGPPVPDYSINSIDLAIDVTQRLAYRWESLNRVEWLLEALGVDFEDATSYTIAHKPQQFGDTAVAVSFGLQKCTECICSNPLVPHIAIEHMVHSFGVVYKGDDGALHATIRPRQDLPHHTRLMTYISNGCFVTIGERVSGLIINSASALREGDILLSSAGHNSPGAALYCTTVREARTGYYEIIGHAEVRGEYTICDSLLSCRDEACSRRRELLGEFRTYFDAEDAVALLLLVIIDDTDKSWRDRNGLSIDMHFGRTRFSSFAIRSEAFPEWQKEPKEYIINGVPSLDQRSIICARCGGLFVTDSAGVS